MHDINNIHFNVTACLFAHHDLEGIKTRISDLKNKYWSNGQAMYGDELRRVCLHSSEIRRRKGIFHFDKRETYDYFINDLSNLLRNINVKLFSCHTNKLDFVRRYSLPEDPYERSLTLILERISYNVKGKDAIIVLESRGKKEDNRLLRHINNVLGGGTEYVRSEKFSFIKGVYFNGKWNEESNKLTSYWILEIADLYCHPIYTFAKTGQKNRAFQTFEHKLCGYPNYNGRGLKRIP